MIKDLIFILAHQDDEFAIFNILEKEVKEKKNIKIFYLTSGYKKLFNKNKITKRDKESLKILMDIGIKKKNIFFIGRKFSIPVYKLHQNLDIIFNELSNKLKNRETILITHAWEGGNEDHDACNILVKKLYIKMSKVAKCYQFSQYNNYKSGILPFKVQKHISDEEVIHIKINLNQKFKYIKYLFNYTSQFYLWFAIFPFVILRILLNDYGKLIEIKKNTNLRRPHNGRLLYEKMRNLNYNNYHKIFKEFLIAK